MATAKQVFFNSPQALLARRRKSMGGGGAGGGTSAITVTIPFTFSSRLSRQRSRRMQSAVSIRRSQTATPLPRLPQQSHRPSVTTSKSTTTNSGSVPPKRTASACETSEVSANAECPKSAVGTATSEVETNDESEMLSPEEERERKRTKKKCLEWLDGLPSKFTGMHIVQHIVYSGNR
ncbi:hypothetical protein V1264_004412 [Littorina saxatilis]|uniref:Uncharacterized protein n=1 Tax=Littorina saxatilis TaxID=31220 RepID=A0AAN9G6L6_9CAEN